MQRLFTTFPNSWPGAGLLILRLTLAASTFLLAAADSGGSVGLPNVIRQGEWLSGVFLVVGLWTPVVAAARFVAAILMFIFSHETGVDYLLLGILNAPLSMLGPGAWSVDAFLFGRKQFSV